MKSFYLTQLPSLAVLTLAVMVATGCIPWIRWATGDPETLLCEDRGKILNRWLIVTADRVVEDTWLTSAILLTLCEGGESHVG